MGELDSYITIILIWLICVVYLHFFWLHFVPLLLQLFKFCKSHSEYISERQLHIISLYSVHLFAHLLQCVRIHALAKVDRLIQFHALLRPRQLIKQ